MIIESAEGSDVQVMTVASHSRQTTNETNGIVKEPKWTRLQDQRRSGSKGYRRKPSLLKRNKLYNEGTEWESKWTRLQYHRRSGSDG